MGDYIEKNSILAIIMQDRFDIKFNGDSSIITIDELIIKTDFISQFTIVSEDNKVVYFDDIDRLYHFIITRIIKLHGMKFYPDTYRISFDDLLSGDKTYLIKMAKRSTINKNVISLFHHIGTFEGTPLDVSNEIGVNEKIVKKIRNANHKKILNISKVSKKFI